jgi:hypothetical protein
MTFKTVSHRPEYTEPLTQQQVRKKVIEPLIGYIAFTIFALLVMVLKKYFPNSILGTYLFLFF